VRPNAGPVAVGTFNYVLSEQSVAVREAANAAMKKIAERRGLGRFMALTETEGAYASHPLGGCRMAESPDLGVTDGTGAVYGYEGLFCIDSSIIPTSLGVNPSLTIAAVSERAADALVIRGAGLGLPARPAGVPPRHSERDRGRTGGAEAARTGAEEAPQEEEGEEEAGAAPRALHHAALIRRRRGAAMFA